MCESKLKLNSETLRRCFAYASSVNKLMRDNCGAVSTLTYFANPFSGLFHIVLKLRRQVVRV